MSLPAFSTLTSKSAASRPWWLLDPRTVLNPAMAKKAASQAPFLLALTRA